MFMVVPCIYLLISSAAFALGVPNQNCVSDSWWSPLKQVAIMPIDGRYGMADGAAKVGLSPKEAKWLRQVTGVVACKDKDGNLSGGSGTIFEKDDQIITSAHLFIRPEGRLTNCYFQTRSSPPVRRKLIMDPKSVRFATENLTENPGLDFALVKLDQPISKIKPVERIKNPQVLNTQDKVLMVSSQMARMKNKVLPDEPIVQQCLIRNLMMPRGKEGTSIYTDCSSTQTASGSMLYVRDDKGQLVGTAILRGSGGEDQDYQPYSFAKRNMSRNLVFDGEVKKFLDNVVAPDQK